MVYYFIVNPHSQTRKSQDIWKKQLMPLLSSMKIRWRVFYTQYVGHCTEIVRDLTRNPAVPITIVIIGGDGTLNEAVNGIVTFNKLTLACIPLGSSNDFARGMGIKGTPEQMLKNILRRDHEIMLDYGVVRSGNSPTQRFLVSSGIGFDAYVTDEALSSPIKDALNAVHLGKLTYAVIALKKLVEIRLQPAVLSVDDGRKFRHRRFYFASSHNLPFEGGGFRFTPDARPDDGLLNVCVVTSLPKLCVLACLPTAFWGGHLKIPGIYTFTCRKLHVSLPHEYPVHTDGETYHPRTSVDVWCEPGKIHFVY